MGDAINDTPTDTENEEEGEVLEEEEHDEHTTWETWDRAVAAMVTTTRRSHPFSPPFDLSDPAPFQSYWRGVFARLHEAVMADPNIPEHLTSPQPPPPPPSSTSSSSSSPTFSGDGEGEGGGDDVSQEFAVMFFSATDKSSCPCCLPEVEPGVLVRDGGGGGRGVTKGELVRAVGEYLYGAGLPRVYSAERVGSGPGRVCVDSDEDEDEDVDMEEDGEVRTGQLICSSDWMSLGGPEGRKEAYGTFRHNIWLYCRPWEDLPTDNIAETGDGTDC